MVHLRIVAPDGLADRVVDLLDGVPSVINVVRLADAARKPRGDLIECDVAREDASVVLEDLRSLGVHDGGSIAAVQVDTAISRAADRAEQAAAGAPADAVLWEQVTEHTSESATLSGSFALFMALAASLAAVGILLDSEILVVGAMVVGPEFGPVAGVCVALIQRRARLALRSAVALVVGFPLAIAAVLAVMLLFRAVGAAPDTFGAHDHSLSATISSPDFFAFFVAFCAGIAGIISLTTAKSGALIGVLISVTTIPAAANVGVASSYGDWESASGSLAQLGLNLTSLLAAGVLTLAVQRALYVRRRARHMADLRRSSPARTTRRSSSGSGPPRR